MKCVFAGLLLFVLISCAQIQEQTGDWIDLPLSDHTYSENIASYRTGEYEIPLAAGDALEYSFDISEGDTIVYEWDVEMRQSELLEVEFHGHTNRVSDEPGIVMFYHIHNDGSESGTLTAPFSGMHGWYLNNTSAENVVINLTVSGFYSERAQ